MANHARSRKQPPKSAPAHPGWWRPILQGLLIAAAACWVFWPALHGDWLWEDDLYVTDNSLLNDPAALWKIWFQPGTSIEYYPIEESFRWCQWHLWHTDTLGYHITNLVLHILNALLVWRLLEKFDLRTAWAGGLLFAIHPALVESVAWIAELKNTLSLIPFLITMIFWIDYEQHHRRRDYFLALGFFLVAMLCKISMSPFPLIILLFAWWKRGRVSLSDLRNSLPFLLISLVLGGITIAAGNSFRDSHAQPPDIVSMGNWLSQVALGGLTLSFYFLQSVWPFDLRPIYPRWDVDSPTLLQFLPWPLFAGLFWVFWLRRQTWGRHLLLGTGFFVVMLLPFLGFHAISYMSFTWVMDHFLYIPIIGLIGLAVAGWQFFTNTADTISRSIGLSFVAGIFVVFAWEGHSYAARFTDEETLWTYTVSRDPSAWLAHYNLGEALVTKHEPDSAREQFERTLELSPSVPQAHNNLGLLLLQSGDINGARPHLEKALEIYPNFAEAHENLGLLYFKTGHLPEAIGQYREAIRLNHLRANTYNNLANALYTSGQLNDAVEAYQTALKLNPLDSMPHNNLGLLLMRQGNTRQAIDEFEEALRLQPDMADTRNNLGIALFKSGHLEEAIAQFSESIRLAPDYADAHNNLGIALVRTGRIPEAASQFASAIQINPSFTDARKNLQLLRESAKTGIKKH